MITARQVADHHGTDPRNVRNYVRRDGKPGQWAKYVTPGTYDFLEMPPPYVAKPNPRYQKKVKPMVTNPLPAALVEALGPLYTPAQCLMKPGDMPEPPADYTDRLPWALYWADRGLAVQPAAFLLGTLIQGSVEALKKPSAKQEFVERMWAEASLDPINHDTDIACWPDPHRMFVIEVCHQCEEVPDIDFEDGALIINRGMLGDVRYWYPGRCYTKLHALGRWVHVIGIGRHSYLPPSAVPGYAR